jgi:chemotaxis protein methyltransferase WspC
MPLPLEVLLQEAMGLDVASIGASAVERAVQARMQASNHSDMHRYIEFARASESELQQLIETIAVPETWFWRDPSAFSLLSRWALESWVPNNPQASLRMLSLPCSTGEEPYSMAMALLDAGFPPGRLSIDAVDISERSLALARRAVYGKNSFRGAEMAFRGRHFDATAAGWKLRESVQAHVRFQQGNLFGDHFMSGTGRYDAIFCRNVLIYFDRVTQDRAIAVLQRLLAPKAIVFVGPSETSLLASHGFEAIKAPLAFAFQKRDATETAKRPIARAVGLAKPPAPRQPAALVRDEPKAAVQSNGLDEAIELADAGRSAEAATCCAEHVKKCGPTARAFRLTGMLRAQAGDLTGAAANYRSAVYLDPYDYEALFHLAMLLEKRGYSLGADVLFRRAQRIESRGTGTTS